MTAQFPTAPPIDWDALPVTEVPVGRFVISLAGISLEALTNWAAPDGPDRADEPVLAMTRSGSSGHGDVWVYNGRHRVLRGLLLGWDTIPARLLAIP